MHAQQGRCDRESEARLEQSRFIHDLSRSGVNQQVFLPERVVLPRLMDVVRSALVLLRQRSASCGVEFGVLDYGDAFQQLTVSDSERGYVTGCLTCGWFAYRKVLFCIGCRPLLWGRTAALTVRATLA